jgi:anion-transporting  ArsA/GET3 family ATPase
MRELLTVGKVWELAQDARRTPGGRPYDLVVLDAPATGHGVAILEAPRTFAEIARVGPIHRQGRTIDAMLSDPARTGVVVVARPEEMPVNEALALERALAARVGLPVSLVVANALVPDRFSGPEVEALGAADGHPAAALARDAAARARAQRGQLARLRRGTAAPVCRLPYLAAPGLGPDVLGDLADRLERTL